MNHSIRSLTDLLDNTCTALGKRNLFRMLTSPIRDIKTLNKRYDMIEEMFDIQDLLRSSLKNIYDLERLHRKVALQHNSWSIS